MDGSDTPPVVAPVFSAPVSDGESMLVLGASPEPVRKGGLKKILIIAGGAAVVIVALLIVLLVVIPASYAPKEEAAKTFHSGLVEYLAITSTYDDLVDYNPKEKRAYMIERRDNLTPFNLTEEDYKAFKSSVDVFRNTQKSLDELSGKIKDAPEAFASDWKAAGDEINATLSTMMGNIDFIYAVHSAFLYPLEDLRQANAKNYQSCMNDIGSNDAVKSLLDSSDSKKSATSEAYMTVHCRFTDYVSMYNFADVYDTKYDVVYSDTRKAETLFLDAIGGIDENSDGGNKFAILYEKLIVKNE